MGGCLKINGQRWPTIHIFVSQSERNYIKALAMTDKFLYVFAINMKTKVKPAVSFSLTAYLVIHIRNTLA